MNEKAASYIPEGAMTDFSDKLEELERSSMQKSLRNEAYGAATGALLSAWSSGLLCGLVILLIFAGAVWWFWAGCVLGAGILSMMAYYKQQHFETAVTNQERSYLFECLKAARSEEDLKTAGLPPLPNVKIVSDQSRVPEQGG